MFVVETNVLIYAADRDAADHAACRDLIERCRGQPGPWYLTWGIVYEFLRVTTHPSIFRRLFSANDAWSFLDSLFASPGLGMLTETERPAPLKRHHIQRENLGVEQTKGGNQMPRGKKELAEQIIPKLREVEVEVGRGKTVLEAVKKIGVTEQTYYRWKKKFGGLRIDQAKRLKDLEKENSRLKRFLADAELDKAILREAASGRPWRRSSTSEPFHRGGERSRGKRCSWP